jgi:hypothetical protein
MLITDIDVLCCRKHGCFLSPEKKVPGFSENIQKRNYIPMPFSAEMSNYYWLFFASVKF